MQAPKNYHKTYFKVCEVVWREALAKCYFILKNMYYVYILQSVKDKSYYTGVTTDLKKRFQDHNWHQAKYTSTKAPYKLVWYCAFQSKSKAYDFEKYLKSSSGFAFRNKRLL